MLQQRYRMIYKTEKKKKKININWVNNDLNKLIANQSHYLFRTANKNQQTNFGCMICSAIIIENIAIMIKIQIQLILPC